MAPVAKVMIGTFQRLERLYDDLKTHLSFYVGAINLTDHLAKRGYPITYPVYTPGVMRFKSLHSLTLPPGHIPQDFDFKATGSFAVLITGVNRGGKTVFLKTVGQSILLARAGLFVPAEEYVFPSTGAVFTHFPRGEEKTMS
jgi:DNA mismatch repair ATPase MutS